jgi:hypothetical protein
MTLAEVIKAVDELSPDEIRQLRDYLETRQAQQELDIEGIKQIFSELREGFSEQDLQELEWAMNAEYIEPVDDNDES